MAVKWASKKRATSFFGHVIMLRAFSLLHPKRQRYCHTELVFSNNDWFSSREFSNAVSFSRGIPKGEKIEDYDFIEIPCTVEEEERLRKWCEREQFNEDGTRCGYDKQAILFQFLPIPISWQSVKDWFCTEVCSAAIQTLSWLTGYTAASLQPTDAHYELLDETKRVSYIKNRIGELI